MTNVTVFVVLPAKIITGWIRSLIQIFRSFLKNPPLCQLRYLPLYPIFKIKMYIHVNSKFVLASPCLWCKLTSQEGTVCKANYILLKVVCWLDAEVWWVTTTQLDIQYTKKFFLIICEDKYSILIELHSNNHITKML